MILRAAAFSDRGMQWSTALGVMVERPRNVREWTANAFHSNDALLFIGAAGIAVRAIAGHIQSKTTDPAVLVMDELGRHVIPLLSGHIGGANELALEISRKTGAEPVITTATDLNGIPAIDVWAVKNNCAIENPETIKSVSATALRGQNVGVMIAEQKLTPPFPVTLVLRPRTLVLGAGCKRGVAPDAFEKAVMAFMEACGMSLLSVKALASIDVKAEERAFTEFAAKYRLPFYTYSAEELRGVQGIFAHSDYVEKTVGVGNVCERAAVKASGGRLLMGKTTYEGITLALAGEEDV